LINQYLDNRPLWARYAIVLKKCDNHGTPLIVKYQDGEILKRCCMPCDLSVFYAANHIMQ